MTTLRLAFRNLRRNRRRSLLTGIALGLGLFILVLMRGTLDGIQRQSILNLIRYDLAHVKAFAPGYLDEDFPGLDHVLLSADSLLMKVGVLPGVRSAVVRLTMTGQLISGDRELFVSVVGLDPRRDRRVFSTLDAVVAGKTLEPGESGALLGESLAAEAGVKPGDLITLLVRSAPGAYDARSLTVRGILATGHPKVDRVTVYLPLSVVRDMARLPGGATEIAVLGRDERKAGKLRDRLAMDMPGFDWRSWRDLAEDFLALARAKYIGNGLMVAIFAFLAGVAVANTMVMAVHERTREIGAMRAMGFTPGQVGWIFLEEGMALAAIAGAIALVLGGALVAYLGVKGISLA
ncbi:MAG TPA: ABC transporter permease, partial [Bacteroidetes bacterium]|nr:ABC transporter permease [Bacteroidota bacterium]